MAIRIPIGPPTNDEDLLCNNSGIFVWLLEVQCFALAKRFTAALDFIELLPHPGPLPVAAVTHNRLNFLIWHHRILFVR